MDKELLDLESNLIGSIILDHKKFLLSQEKKYEKQISKLF